MPKKENMKLGEFFYLVPEEQNMRLLFSGLEVSGTQDSISCIANEEVNGMTVVNVEAEDGFLKVWLKDENT
jgi:hypothetical protein